MKQYTRTLAKNKEFLLLFMSYEDIPYGDVLIHGVDNPSHDQVLGTVEVTISGMNYTVHHARAVLDVLYTLNSSLDENPGYYDLSPDELQDWLDDMAFDSGVLGTCPICRETIWTEEGCPNCESQNEQNQWDEEFAPAGWDWCKKHEKRFWSEDACPICRQEYEDLDRI